MCYHILSICFKTILTYNHYQPHVNQAFSIRSYNHPSSEQQGIAWVKTLENDRIMMAVSFNAIQEN
jgi:hypothetical protein